MQNLISLAKDTYEKSNGLLQTAFRVASYCSALGVTMWLSENYFDDTYSSNIGLFTLFVVAFEMLWASSHSGARLWWYVVCVVGIVFAGALLVREGAHVQAEHHAAKALHARVKGILGDAPGLIVSTDDTGNIEGVSSAMLRLTGYQQEELLGRSVELLFPDEGAAQLRRDQGDLLRANDGWSVHKKEGVVLRTKAGGRVLVTKYLFGVRYSLCGGARSDLQFLSVVTR
jgi:PAS domain S-box-containing protein